MAKRLYKFFKTNANFFFTFCALKMVDICKVNEGEVWGMEKGIEN